MDYFNDLLESYSRLKQRKLVLIEKKEPEKKEPEKNLPEYSREDVMVKALKALPAYPPISSASFQPIPNVLVKDKEGNEKEILAYQKTPDKKSNQPRFPAVTPDTTSLEKATFREKTAEEKTGHGAIIAAKVTHHGSARVMNSDGTPNEPQFTTWYEKFFLGKEALGTLDGAGLSNALNRVGESIRPMLESAKVPDSIQAVITNQLRNMVNIANDLVIAARGKNEEKPWTGWKEGEDGEKGEYIGKPEADSTDPEMTRSVGSYISGRSKKSIEYQLAHGKTITYDKDVGVVFDDLARDGVLIQGCLDSVQAFMELGKAELVDKDSKCNDIGRRVKRKGNRLIFLRNHDDNQGIALPRSDIFKFIESQITERCGADGSIKTFPQAKYTPQQLNDMRGKGFEHGAVAVGVIPNLQAMPAGKTKNELFRMFAGYVSNELLTDEARFSAAYIDLEESEGVALSTRALFVTEAMTQLRILTNTPKKARAFFQRVYDMEKPVVDAMKPDFTFPIGLKTGIGYADDLAYAYKSPASAQAAADGMGLQKNNAVHEVKVSELKKELERGKHGMLGDIFQRMHSLGDDDMVYLVGSSQKSYFEDGSLKFGETVQRSGAVNGTADNMAPGFDKVTMSRLGINTDDLDSLREYQDELDSIDTALGEALPLTGNIYTDSNNNQQSINFGNIATVVEDVAVGLSLNSDMRAKLKSTISDYQGNATDLNGPDNVIQRAELKNELSRIITSAKQYQDITSTDPTDIEIQLAEKMAADQKKKARGKKDPEYLAGEGDANGDGKLTAEEIAAKRVRDAKLNLAYTIHMGGGTLRDGVLNKKVFNDNRVRAGSHMAPLNTNTLGLINDVDGHKLTMSTSMMSLNLNGPDGTVVSLGAERARASGDKYDNLSGEQKGLPITRSIVTVNAAAQKKDAKVDVKIDVGETLNNSLMVNFLKGQARLIEELLLIDTN